MEEWSQFYRQLGDWPTETGRAGVWLSPAVNDPKWDDFLRRSPHGQYQQSSLWAEFKVGEGWNHHRVVTTGPGGITGGFQLLWKKKGPVRIGYVSKGPVAQPGIPALRRGLIGFLRQSARELGLQALIIQSPDEDQANEISGDGQTDFIQSNPMDVIEATYLVDVTGDLETVRRRMNRKLRQCVRKAGEKGLVVRAGSEADLPLFFELMSATCRRQKSAPNPGSLDSLRRLWHLFARSGSIEMAFAHREGRDIAGRVNLVFGDRVTQWKKGWDGSHYDCHPNELLADNALEWAQARGYRVCDFSAINRLTALHLLAGRTIDSAEARSRDMFNLRLGGYPKLLPRAGLFIANPVLRWGYLNSYGRFEKRRDRRRQAESSPRPPASGNVSPAPKLVLPPAGGGLVAPPSDHA